MSPVHDGAGRVVRLLSVSRDITDRSLAQNALVAHLADSRRLQEISTSLIAEDDPKALYGQILVAAIDIMHSDMGSLQAFDAASNELRLLSWRGFHPDSAEFWAVVRIDSAGSCAESSRTLKRVIVQDTETCDSMTGTLDLDHFRLSGIRSIQSTPLLARDGRLVGMISTHWREVHQPAEPSLRLLDVLARQAADLIERVNSEKALRKKEAELEAIITETPFMLTRCSRDLTYRYVSRAYAEMIHRTPEEIAGKPLIEIMGEEGWRTIAPYVERVLQGERVEYEDDVDFHGEARPYLHVVYTPDRIESGEVVGWFSSIVDVTQRRRVERDALRRERLEAAVRFQEAERRRVAREVHDKLGQQVTGLRMTLVNLIEEAGDAAALRTGIQQVQDLASILDKDVSLIAFELRADVPDDMDLAEALADYVADWTRTCGVLAKFHACGHPSQKRLPDIIVSNLYRMAQEALNNINKHAKARNVSVILDENEHRIRLVVEDDGVGFRQKDLGRAPRKSGHGLGLIGMKERVDLIGGHLEIDSKPGRGTTIFVTVPLDGATV